MVFWPMELFVSVSYFRKVAAASFSSFSVVLMVRSKSDMITSIMTTEKEEKEAGEHGHPGHDGCDHVRL